MITRYDNEDIYITCIFAEIICGVFWVDRHCLPIKKSHLLFLAFVVLCVGKTGLRSTALVLCCGSLCPFVEFGTCADS